MKTNFNPNSPLDTAKFDADRNLPGALVKEKNGQQSAKQANANQLQSAVKNLTTQFGGASALHNVGVQTAKAAPNAKTQTVTQPPPPVAPPPAPKARKKKGLFGWISDAASSVGNVVKKGVQAVGSAVTTTVKAVGTATKAVGNFLGSAVKAVGKVAVEAGRRIGDAFHSIGSGLVSGLVGAVKNIFEGVGDVLGGALKILDVRPLAKIFKGDFAGAFEGYGKNILNGLKDIGVGVLKATVQTATDALIVGAVSTLSAIQVLIGVETKGRKLNDTEIAELKKVYGDSIDYSSVRVKEGKSGLLGLNDRPFTVGNTIYMKNDKGINTLVHEMGHVWQHQNGGTDYLTEAIGAQWFGDGYDFEKGLKEGKSFSELNPEQQCELIQVAHQNGYFNNPSAGFTHNGVDYTKQLEDALKQIRAGQGAP